MFARRGGLALVGVLGTIVAIGLGTRLRHGLDVTSGSVHEIWQSWRTVVVNPRYFACLSALALLETFVPARRDIRRLGVGMAQDATWFVMSTLLTLTVVSTYLAVLDTGLTRVAGSWHPDLTKVIGTGAVALIAFVIGDLCAWWSHWLHHRNATLWQFHAVHHSQTAMNVLSDNRQHIVETLVNSTLIFVPARMLGLGAADSALLAFVALAFAAFIHANIRTDLGPLRFVLISPQAHRVHHSIYEQHYDTNYGSVFAFWDYVFRTRHHDRAAYPVTGISDDGFPMERTTNPVGLLRTWWAQTRYPFAAIKRASEPRTRVRAQ